MLFTLLALLHFSLLLLFLFYAAFISLGALREALKKLFLKIGIIKQHYQTKAFPLSRSLLLKPTANNLSR